MKDFLKVWDKLCNNATKGFKEESWEVLQDKYGLKNSAREQLDTIIQLVEIFEEEEDLYETIAKLIEESARTVRVSRDRLDSAYDEADRREHD